MRFHILTCASNSSRRPLNAAKSDRMQISFQLLTLSHSAAGLACGLSRDTPPVSMNSHSAWSISPLPFRMRTVSRNAKSSLSFSSSERQMLTYSEYVK